MSSESNATLSGVSLPRDEATRFGVLGALSFSHFLNDMIQSVVIALYPLLKSEFSLSFGQIGLITLAYQMTASLLQPVVGIYTDRHPRPYSVVVGMGFTLSGIIAFAFAPNFGSLLCAAALVGTGSSIFHPESSRVARLASGGQHGLAQSIFQVGGNSGAAVGPLLVAGIIYPNGLRSFAWFASAALLAMIVLSRVAAWYRSHRVALKARAVLPTHVAVPHRTVITAMIVLLLLVFSKYVYLASLSSFYTFYLIERFAVPVQQAQIYLFFFLGAAAVGTLAGGPIGDRIGRKYVIWGSILGVAPFTLALPYASLPWTVVLTVFIGLIISSAFSAILVYAQELIPGRVGTISGLFFGLAFGMAGLGAALLGRVADATSLVAVYHMVAYLPLLGLLAIFLPDLERYMPGKVGKTA